MNRNTFRPSSLASLLLAACGGSQPEPQAAPTQLQCTIDGQEEMRVMRDCTSELSYQERDLAARVEAFGVEVEGSANVQFRPVEDSLMLLTEQQRSMCRDWNACALSRQEYVQRSEWLTSQFTTLTQLLDAASPETMQDPAARERVLQQILDWAARARELQVQERVETERNRIAAEQVEVAAQANAIDTQATAIAGQSAAAETDQAASQQRIASAEEEQARVLREQAEAQRRAQEDQRAAMAQGNVQARVQMEVTLQQQERELAEQRAFLDLVGRVRTESAAAAGGKAPRVCGNRDARSKLSTTATSGSSASYDARSIGDKVDDLCGRFDKWARPDDTVRLRIAAFFEHLDRIEGFMRDSIRCAGMTDAAERRRCENSYGPSRAEDEAAAQRALGVLGGVRRELEGVREARRPFPCQSQTWGRIRTMQWSGGMARTWMPGLPDQANTVCRVIGVDEDGLGGVRTQLGGNLDRAEANTRQRLRMAEDNVTRIRAMLR